ncbi:MAG: hypothetical protein IKZ88_04385 [Neisseriaceae bacterium]|nr:hypothetical protein [Neisseriaceae bacterium]
MTEQEKQEVAGMFGWEFVRQLEDKERAEKSYKFAKRFSLIMLFIVPLFLSFTANSFGDYIMLLVLAPIWLIAVLSVIND